MSDRASGMDAKAAFSREDSLRLKGVAIVMLVFHHCFYSAKNYEGFDIDFLALGEARTINIALFCKTCVSIFAFITGYGLYLSFEAHSRRRAGEGTGRWVAVRYVKTMSGFWFVYLLSYGAAALYRGLPTSVYGTNPLRHAVCALLDALGLSKLLGTPYMLNTWWYMGAVQLFIAVTPLCFLVLERAGSLSLLFCIAALPRALGTGFPGGNNGYSFLFACALGMVFARHDVFSVIERVLRKEGGPLRKAAGSAGLLVVLYVAYRLYGLMDKRQVWELHWGLIPLVFILFLKYCVLNIPLLSRVLTFLGKHSMNIFLVHSFIRYRFRLFHTLTYSFGSVVAIPAMLLLASLCISVAIEFLKGAVGYPALVDKVLSTLDERR